MAGDNRRKTSTSDLALAVQKLDKLAGTPRNKGDAAVLRKELAGDVVQIPGSRLCNGTTVTPEQFNALVKDVWAITARLSVLDKFNE